VTAQDDTRDRVIRLEAELEHVAEKLDDVHAKVTELHDLMNQAKGVKWLLLVLAAVAGFLGAKGAAILGFFWPPTP